MTALPHPSVTFRGLPFDEELLFYIRRRASELADAGGQCLVLVERRAGPHFRRGTIIVVCVTSPAGGRFEAVDPHPYLAVRNAFDLLRAHGSSAGRDLASEGATRAARGIMSTALTHPATIETSTTSANDDEACPPEAVARARES